MRQFELILGIRLNMSIAILQDCKADDYFKSQEMHLFVYYCSPPPPPPEVDFCFESDYDRLLMKTIIEKQKD